MIERTSRPIGYWQHLERVVAAKVDAALRWGAEDRGPVIAYLRDLEDMARAECDRRETIQLIASGRRLLGDGNGRGAPNAQRSGRSSSET